MIVPCTAEAKSFNPEPVARPGTIEIPFYRKALVAAEGFGDEPIQSSRRHRHCHPIKRPERLRR